MDRKSKTYLLKSAASGGYAHESIDLGFAGQLEAKGFITIGEKMSAIKGLGVAPIPHLTATQLGRTMAAAIGKDKP